ncbi:hypothetical protein [Roseateles sp.]
MDKTIAGMLAVMNPSMLLFRHPAPSPALRAEASLRDLQAEQA